MRIEHCTFNQNNCPYYERDNGYGYCSKIPEEDVACFWDEQKFSKMSKVIYCPVNGWDCPYFDANGCCMMYPDTDPIKECDDFAMFWEEGEDYIYNTDEDEGDSERTLESFQKWERLCEKDVEEWLNDEPDEPDVDETFYDPYMGCDFYE